MFDIFIVLALAVLTLLLVRTVLRGRTGRARPPQRTNTLDQTSAPADRFSGVAIQGSSVAQGLDAITAADKHFDLRHFIDGAKSAYEMVVTAYADGDRRTLTDLLATEVYEGFEAVIRERKGRGEMAETRLLSLDAADITAAELRGKTAYITLRFVSQFVSATRDLRAR
jgi:predicted lipid-binding transport protein (Tim44 family)